MMTITTLRVPTSKLEQIRETRTDNNLDYEYV